jgi:hypothetical protein
MVDSDPERTKRVMEGIRQQSQLCRTCKHERFGHYAGKCGAVRRWDGKCACKCKEFVPPDNLDYMEWLAKKRGLIK